jgi:hypothetical protein
MGRGDTWPERAVIHNGTVLGQEAEGGRWYRGAGLLVLKFSRLEMAEAFQISRI